MAEVKIKECTLTDQELIDLCQEWVRKICKSGGKAFTMSIPARVNYDTDLVFSELITRFQKVVTHEPKPS